MIIRPDYINALKPFIDAPLVKILSGVRRCGKSTVLAMMTDVFKKMGVNGNNIIERRYNETGVYESFTAEDMYNDLKTSMKGKGRCYLLLDELQEINGWEKAVNSLLESCDADIYVTGSNSKLMSSEISSYLTGRYVSVPVYTLSFKEYLSFKGVNPNHANDAFDDYIRYGGFPIIGAGNFDISSAYQIVDGIYSSVITRDISKRHNIRNSELFDRVVKYIVENVGMTFSANSIVKFLKNEGRSISIEVIYNYLKWLTEAFIIYPCQRYDLQGKAVLKTQEKYYLSDVSFIYSQLGFDIKMLSAVFENIIFLEMKRRGYEVYIGKNNTKEIDFVAVLRNEKIFVQVCVALPSESSRESDNLMELNNHYHKYIVCRDRIAHGDFNGIEIVSIADFLLRDKW